ncbi:MAG: hypothetical protein C0469_07770 [Cyanobacteria bacterium DS2.3.42]|nr:hypothetical protein [Cyanobacteria bacterium DS2.3.42]
MSEYIEIRCSSIPSYGDCPRRSAAKLFRETLVADGFLLNPSRPSAAAAIGTAIHKGVANLLRAKQATGEFIASEVANAAGLAWESFNEETKEGVIWDKTTPHGMTAEAQIRGLLYSFVPILDSITPTHIEVPLEAIISPLGEQAIPVKVTGTMDVRDVMGVIHDHKTGTKQPSPQAQLGGYIAVCRLNDIEVTGARVNFAKREGIKKTNEGLRAPKPIPFDAEECLSAFWSTVEEIQRHYEKYLEAKDPWSFPANPMSMLCTPKYCNAHCTNFCTMGGTEDAEE